MYFLFFFSIFFQQVNIIVPLKGHVSKYTTFLDHLVRNVLPHDPNLSLTVVYFSDSYISEVRNLTTKRLEGLPAFKWSFIPVDEKEFSRGHGLHIGAQSTAMKDTGDLLFFCDVDVLMHHDFFTRCRSNTRKGYQVRLHRCYSRLDLTGLFFICSGNI